MKTILKRNSHILLFISIIIALSAYMVYWGTQKNGFHIDEMYSLMDVRGGGLNRPHYTQGFYDTWFDASELESTIVVTEENAFTYSIRRPRHPFFILLHTAYSFYPGVFSVWPSVVMNIILFIAALIVLYKLSLLFIDNKHLALLPPLVWGVSSAAINLVVFIRHYMLFTLLCLSLTYIVFIATKSSFSKWWHIASILLISFLGILTHQYFLVYAFFLSAFTCVYLLITKQFKPFIKFTVPMIVAISLYQFIAGGYFARLYAATGRLGDALEILRHGDGRFLHRINRHLEIVSETVFGNISSFLVVLLLLVLVATVYFFKMKNEVKLRDFFKEPNVGLWLIMVGSCLFYFLMIAKIAPFHTIPPYLDFRYISNITPFIMLLLISLLVNSFKTLGLKSNLILFALISIPLTVLLTANIKDYYLYRNDSNIDEALSHHYHLPVVHISDDVWRTASSYWHFFEFENQILFATIQELDMDIILQNPFEDGLLLVAPLPRDNALIPMLKDKLDLYNYTFVTYLQRHVVYILE